MMRNIFTHLLLVLLALRLTLADVSISRPQKGSTFTGGSAIEVSWVDDNAFPSLSDAEYFTFTLMTGLNGDIQAVKTLEEEVASSRVTSKSISLTIPATAGADGAYYIQVYVKFNYGYSIHYSNRFTLTGMSGTFQPVGTVSMDPPSPEYDIQASVEEINSASFTVPYTLQTGPTRYAPMQLQPNTKITATTWTRKFPTSSVSYYTTLYPSLQQVSTITPGWSYTISSAINHATPAGYPADHGSWYPASARIVAATLSAPEAHATENSNKRRWDD